MGDVIDWVEIWDGLDNERNWEAKKYQVQSTLVGVRGFRNTGAF